MKKNPLCSTCRVQEYRESFSTGGGEGWGEGRRGDRNVVCDRIAMFSQLVTRSIHDLVSGFWTIMQQAIFSCDMESIYSNHDHDAVDSVIVKR